MSNVGGQNLTQGFNANQQQQPQQYQYDQTQTEGQQQQQQNDDRPTQYAETTGAGKGYRPYVDPNAVGEVDPQAYPEPKESTDKIRGRSDILQLLCSNVTQELLIAKTFYFFFFSAFGSLFPLMAVYFKQMGMNPLQTGILIGCRPFIEFIAAPFWGNMADRFQKGKLMLLCSVFAWIVFTLLVGFIQPAATCCVGFNGTHYILKDLNKNTLKKRSLSQEDLEFGKQQYFNSHSDFEEDGLPQSLMEEHFSNLGHLRSKRDTSLPPDHVVGKSPHVVHYTVNYKDYKESESFLSPPFSSIVYREADIQKVFFLLLLLVILGEFFSCPAITLADTAVLNYLGDEADQYGSQRMFGSLGWGLAMFFVGIALDHSTVFPGHPCSPHERERNYTICFAVFSVLMGCAFITATQFKFQNAEEPVTNTIALEEVKDPLDNGPRPWNEPKIPMKETRTGRQQVEAAIGKMKTRIFANTMKEMPEWMVVLREFKTLRCGTFLFVAWWMGFGIGLIFSFLFWHLQDYNGTPTVFGIASVINHISEIFAYFFSFRLISQIGHVKVLCIGLLGNVLRFLYISWITNPWWVLPFEFIQGMTHAAVWAACCSYIAHNTKLELRGSAQGVLQGIHHGFGRGAGAIFGGIFVNRFGTPAIFRAYGVASIIILCAFVFIHFYRKDVGFQHDLPPEEDPRQFMEEGTALAPHGVPANPLPRAHSSQKLNDMPGDQSGYGTYSNNGMLDIPGGGGGSTNPFGQSGSGPGSGTGGTTQYKSSIGEDKIVQNDSKFQFNYAEDSKYDGVQERGTGDDVADHCYRKGSPIRSPDTALGYDEIKNRFQAYNNLLRGYGEEKRKNSNSNPSNITESLY